MVLLASHRQGHAVGRNDIHAGRITAGGYFSFDLDPKFIFASLYPIRPGRNVDVDTLKYFKFPDNDPDCPDDIRLPRPPRLGTHVERARAEMASREALCHITCRADVSEISNILS